MTRPGKSEAMRESERPGTTLLEEMEQSLRREGATDAALQVILERVLSRFDCVTGTIHGLDPGSGMLHLLAQRGVPDAVVERVRVVPVGKGMAGLAAERRAPVQVCNLQTDTSGMAEPGAKETRMEGAIAVPVLAGDALRGVIGIAKPAVYEFTAVETEALLRLGDLLGKYLFPQV